MDIDTIDNPREQYQNWQAPDTSQTSSDAAQAKVADTAIRDKEE